MRTHSVTTGKTNIFIKASDYSRAATALVAAGVDVTRQPVEENLPATVAGNIQRAFPSFHFWERVGDEAGLELAFMYQGDFTEETKCLTAWRALAEAGVIAPLPGKSEQTPFIEFIYAGFEPAAFDNDCAQRWEFVSSQIRSHQAVTSFSPEYTTL